MTKLLFSKKTYELSDKEIREICLLKDTHWKFGLNSQLEWFKKNIESFDIHNTLIIDKKLVGYTLLRNRKMKTSVTKNYLLFDTLIIKENYRNKKLSKSLMDFNNQIIKKNKNISFLMCSNDLVRFYKKYDWIKINKNHFNVIDHKFKNNGMIFNNYKDYSNIDFYTKIKKINIALYYNNIRGVSVFNYLHDKKNINISCVIISKKNLNRNIIFEIKKKMIPYKIVNNVNDKKIYNYIKEKNIDLNIICGFPYIFKKDLINLPKFNTINLHAGKLPEYRGGSPLNWQIINNEKFIGISLIKIDDKIDTGDIIDEYKFLLKKNYTIVDVHSVVNKVFPLLVFKAIEKICIKKINIFKKQTNKKAKLYRQRKPSDGRIVWANKNNLEIFNLIRAITTPYPCAYTFNKKRKKIKIFDAKISSNNFKNLKIGEIKKIKDNIYVQCKKGVIQITRSSHKLNDKEFLF